MVYDGIPLSILTLLARQGGDDRSAASYGTADLELSETIDLDKL